MAVIADQAFQMVKVGIAAGQAIVDAFNSNEPHFEMRHNLKVGNVSPKDVCFNKIECRVGGALIGCRKEVYHLDNMVNGNPITAIYVLDKWDDNTGGNPKIVGGGQGHAFVDVEITSQAMRGFDFKIVIFGKP